MQITTMGLVLRATKTGENDRVISMLTPEHGVISAMAKGSLRLKNKLFSCTGLFCYGEFTLFEGKSMYTVNEGQVHEVFFGLHEDIDSMAHAMYFSELVTAMSPHGQEADTQLKLLLNTFYFLSSRKREPALLKLIFELRTMCNSGYQPDLVACGSCMCFSADAFYFDIEYGGILCKSCADESAHSCNLDMPSISALRHIAYSEDKALFNFSLAENSLKSANYVIENYVLHCIEKPLKSLTFLHSLKQ